MAIGHIFWAENKPNKTRKFLNQAVTLDKDNGDAWANLYKFEKQYSTQESGTP